MAGQNIKKPIKTTKLTQNIGAVKPSQMFGYGIKNCIVKNAFITVVS